MRRLLPEVRETRLQGVVNCNAAGLYRSGPDEVQRAHGFKSLSAGILLVSCSGGVLDEAEVSGEFSAPELADKLQKRRRT
ncbi:hypothetical protein D3C71_1740990 [compost metagenome]